MSPVAFASPLPARRVVAPLPSHCGHEPLPRHSPRRARHASVSSPSVWAMRMPDREAPPSSAAPPAPSSTDGILFNCHRSKMILTRRVFSWTLRRRLSKMPIASDPKQSSEGQKQPLQQEAFVPEGRSAVPEDVGEVPSRLRPQLIPRLGSPIRQGTVPIDSLLSPTEPISTFIFQRGGSPFSTRRRPGDPPYRFLKLSHALIEPFSPGCADCSNPRATGSMKAWYQVANRWNVLSRDFRPPLVLSPQNRVVSSPASGGLQRIGVASSSSKLSPLLSQRKWERALGRSPRVIVIGDVHGCVDELQQLLRLADFQPGDQVVFLGDLVAKGPDSVGVVQLAREIGARSVRGNHDFEVVRWLEAHARGDVISMVSLEHAQIARNLGKEEHAWLVDCPWFIECTDMNHLFVHAGFIPGVKLTQQNPRLMMNMRSVLADGTVTAKNVAECEWAKLWKGPQTVVFGHDAFRGLQQHEYARGIDTGCVYGGRLTALLLPENRLISVPAKRSYIAPKRIRASRSSVS